MKLKLVPAFVALAIALPSIAAAMTPEQSVHSDKARSIFAQIAAEENGDED